MNMPGIIDTQIEIADHGRLLRLDYSQLLAYHGGGALAGAALGFRAVQRAAAALSQDTSWERSTLSVTSAHRGPGIVDAIEFVTRCVTRDRFQLENDAAGNPCGSLSAFRFRFSDGRREAEVVLHDGVVPAEFFAAVKRSKAQPDSQQVRAELTAWKARVAAQVMASSPTALYSLRTRACTATAVPEHA